MTGSCGAIIITFIHFQTHRHTRSLTYTYIVVCYSRGLCHCQHCLIGCNVSIAVTVPMFHIVDKSRQINYVFVCRSGKQKSKLKLTRSCATESNIFLFARDLRVIWEQQYTEVCS